MPEQQIPLRDIQPGNAFESESFNKSSCVFIRLDVNGSKNNVVNTASWLVGSMDLETMVKDLGQLHLVSKE